MNSLLKKRLPGILAAGLVTLAVGAASVTPAAASDASASALTAKQKKAKAKALKACNKKRTAKQKKSCKKAVNKKYAKISKQQETPKGKTWTVNLVDPYSFVPNQMNIKVNDSILWDWKNATGREPHDVTPSIPWPSNVNRNDFKSSLAIGPSYTFKRQFTKPGTYSFVCSIHFQMTMNVNVSK
jgi:plastocyanin